MGDPADLLEAIYADPDDDGPRTVYMDYLLERGDPRGEFIALQLPQRRARPDARREQQLLATHRAAWLGAAAARVSEPVFARGFLASATLVGAGPLPREFATVVELRGAVEPAMCAALPALRRVDVVYPFRPEIEIATWFAVVAPTPRIELVRLTRGDVAYCAIRRDPERRAVGIDIEAYGDATRPWIDALRDIDGTGWRLELYSRFRRRHYDIARAALRALPTWDHVLVEDRL